MAALCSGTADEVCHLGTTVLLQSALEVEFNIDKFEEHMNKKGSQECLKSHKFTVSGKTMNIVVFPNGSGESTKGFVDVFLASDDKPDVEVSCTFSMGKTKSKFSNQRINPDRGFSRFTSHEKGKLELKNGVFELQVKIIVKEKKNTVIVGNRKDCPQKWTSSKIFEEKSFTDFEIVSDGKSYPCHKVFLSAASTVLKGMIDSGMKESLNSSLVLESFPEDVMNSFLRFIYTGDMDEKVMSENCVIFLELGEKYDMEDLKEVAEQAMISSLNLENMISFFKAGQMLRGENIRASAKTFIRVNIKNVSDKQKLRTELQGEAELLMELLESLIGI